MIRRVALAGAIAAALPALLLVSGPASADSSVGCVGPSCSLSLSQMIQLKGAVGANPSATVPLDVPPPPCLWEPIGNTTAGAHYIINNYGDVTKATNYLSIYESLTQAKQQLAAGGQPAGTWYLLPINPAAGAAGAAECLKIPLFAFATPGQALPVTPIPTKTLAAYAYNHMTIPSPSLKVNPAGRGYVNLASYVWANWGAPGGHGGTDGHGDYWVTATLLNSNQSATVWAQPGRLQIHASGPGVPYSGGCGINGSHQSDPPANSGPGVKPDCGVMWTGPAKTATVTASVTFRVTWGAGILNGPGPNALPDITITSRPFTMSVAEIQNLNGN